MITSYSMGHKIYFDGFNWKYLEDNSNINILKPCAKCGKISEDGYDPCLGHIEGAVSACCGHGVEKGFIIYENGEREDL